VRRGRTQRGVKSQVGQFSLGDARLDVTAALAFRLRLRAAAGLVARQPVKLGIQAAGGELLARLDLPAALPPMSFLRRLRNTLRAGLGLGNLTSLALFRCF
jgi:hypothetical protein